MLDALDEMYQAWEEVCEYRDCAYECARDLADLLAEGKMPDPQMIERYRAAKAEWADAGTRYEKLVDAFERQ